MSLSKILAISIKTKMIRTIILKWRFFSLALSSLLGVILSKYCHSLLYKFITNANVAPETTPLLFVLLALPTGALLWFFRTHDTRENIHQNDLFDALKMLTDDMVVCREIATQRLIDLTEKVPEYKRNVKLSFIKALKSFSKKNLGNNKWERRTYAQHILKWFNDNNYTAEELDLNGCIFDLQDFTIEKRTSDLFKLFTQKQFKDIKFNDANLQGVNLKNVKFEQASLEDAKLQNSDLQGAILPKILMDINFQGANLQGVDLSNRELKRVNFQGSNLKNTNLSGASLSEVNFDGTDLKG
ncbi:pentapeptide repeat-containing protein [Bathymodiolus septemdierum thioautotrophic gill symbiont]|uniref:Pentapeptide repeat-containing protein n=1 Tax=endosymbiont of Bathymodiolus septemdierum str. Myojin knoll TaxID=1303921 RepID=A0A0P0US38_9GAMM|nr:pentapeptide repeat-containing protein [Bathymodiolus septemdierum thioautotrophic gill symbiont]BAS67794.1 hypothetical protein BSEPE_0801 [endosymbiont of Bathymodiolus septemdierum str. Myojin knoll]